MPESRRTWLGHSTTAQQARSHAGHDTTCPSDCALEHELVNFGSHPCPRHKAVARRPQMELRFAQRGAI